MLLEEDYDMEINLAKLEQIMAKFKSFVEEKDNGIQIESFQDSAFLDHEEGYKSRLRTEQINLIHSAGWTKSDIGTGAIFKTMQSALKANVNLVSFHQVNTFHEKCRSNLPAAELALYELYYGHDMSKSFSDLTGLFGAKYDLLSYLFFLRDDTRFLPIRPSYFDNSFKLLDIPFKTSHKCSWDNYCEFTDVISVIRACLDDFLGFYVRLIDAHSFLWIIQEEEFAQYLYAYKVAAEHDPEIVIVLDPHQNLKKDALVTVSARINQWKYRKDLCVLWEDMCSVTGCSHINLLVASHIKPWRDCTQNNEWCDPHNGLLLTPNLDSAFDKGYISFDEYGQIMISSELSKDTCQKLGIHIGMKLRKTPEETMAFMVYHRNKIFRK